MNDPKDRAVRGPVRFSDSQLAIVRFCAIECEMQVSGERSVWDMVRAWDRALRWRRPRPSARQIIELGKLVEPEDNLDGFRRVGVRVGWNVKMEWPKVPSAVDSLVEHGIDLSPAEWFREYEEIHPFVDGNGRTGQILYNWLNGTLTEPEWAPNFWDDHRRKPGDGAPLRTPGRNDFGRWDPMDDPQPGTHVRHLALNHPDYVVGNDGVLMPINDALPPQNDVVHPDAVR